MTPTAATSTSLVLEHVGFKLVLQQIQRWYSSSSQQQIVGSGRRTKAEHGASPGSMKGGARRHVTRAAHCEAM